MPKKARIKGTTYHLVQPSYAEQLRAAREGRTEPPAAVWVTDAEFKRAQGTKSKHSNTNINNNNNTYSDSVIDSATFMQNVLNEANQDAMEGMNYDYNYGGDDDDDDDYDDDNNKHFYNKQDEYDENEWDEFEYGEEEEWEDDENEDDNGDDFIDNEHNEEIEKNNENEKQTKEHSSCSKGNDKNVENKPEDEMTLLKDMNLTHRNNKMESSKEHYWQEQQKNVKSAKQKAHVTFSLYQGNRSDLKDTDKNSQSKRHALECNENSKKSLVQTITASAANTDEHHMVDQNGDYSGDDDDNVNSENSEEYESDKLFDDEVECEVTDDFLHTLVFGDGPVADSKLENNNQGTKRKSDMNRERERNGAHYNIDEEVWNLMTEEERNAVQASHERGTARRRAHVSQIKPEEEELNVKYMSHKHQEYEEEWQMAHKSALETLDKVHHTSSSMLQDEDVVEHAHTHEDESGALESQFTKMMQEFNVDAAINDADYDDLRTHGPLSMTQYMSALEEFVKERAGIDVQTAEPHKNKGLIQQLKLMSTRAGVFDTDGKGGVFRTTVASDKDVRFAEEFQRETERIRAEAQKRVLMRNQETQRTTSHALEVAQDKSQNENTVKKSMQNNNHNDSSINVSHTEQQQQQQQEEEEDEHEEYTFVTIKSKHDRLDCETAISAYSNYYNQPNVIAPPQSSKRTKKKMQTSATPHHASSSSNNTKVVNNKEEEKKKEEEQEKEECKLASACFVRKENETKEERRLRQKAVKALQRERRKEKAERKKVYKQVEAQELKREAASRAAKSTVHFTEKRELHT